MDVIRDFRRGAVRLHVLHHASEGEITGAWMATELAEHGYPISAGTLYPLLHDLEAAELLISQERVEAGHVVRCYRATAHGRATLSEARQAIRELADELLGAEPADVGLRPADREQRRDPRNDAATEILAGLRRLLDEFS